MCRIRTFLSGFIFSKAVFRFSIYSYKWYFSIGLYKMDIGKETVTCLTVAPIFTIGHTATYVQATLHSMTLAHLYKTMCLWKVKNRKQRRVCCPLTRSNWKVPYNTLQSGIPSVHIIWLLHYAFCPCAVHWSARMCRPSCIYGNKNQDCSYFLPVISGIFLIWVLLFL